MVEELGKEPRRSDSQLVSRIISVALNTLFSLACQWTVTPENGERRRKSKGWREREERKQKWRMVMDPVYFCTSTSTQRGKDRPVNLSGNAHRQHEPLESRMHSFMHTYKHTHTNTHILVKNNNKKYSTIKPCLLMFVVLFWYFVCDLRQIIQTFCISVYLSIKPRWLFIHHIIVLKNVVHM